MFLVERNFDHFYLILTIFHPLNENFDYFQRRSLKLGRGGGSAATHAHFINQAVAEAPREICPVHGEGDIPDKETVVNHIHSIGVRQNMRKTLKNYSPT